MQLIMTGVARLLVIGVVATPQIRAQSQAKATALPSFEVASVKVTPADSLGYTSIVWLGKVYGHQRHPGASHRDGVRG
jgi:hypothetical protein